MRRSIFRFNTVVILLSLLTLAACSGGGGGGGNSGGSGGGTSQAAEASKQTSYFYDGTSVIKKIITTLVDGSQKISYSPGTPFGNTTIDQNDHVTVTGTYSFGGQSQPFSGIVEPKITTAPQLTEAKYPTNWPSSGTVEAPHVSQASGTYIDNTPYSADGTSAATAFRQATLTPDGPAAIGAIRDPNAFVKAPTKGIYDLHWGTPDVNGPVYANNFAQGSASYTLPKSTFIFRSWLTSSSGPCAIAIVETAGCGAKLSAPSKDVIDAWNKGWTGKGQNVLIWDNIGANPLSSHPAIVETIAHRYAWGANFYGMSWATKDPIPSMPPNTVLNLDGTQTSTASALSMSAINMSFGADLEGYLGKQPTIGWSVAQLKSARDYYSGFSSDATLLTQTAWQGAFNFNSAVIVKSAGNDTIDAQYDPVNWYLAQNGNTVLRLLIVGALTDVGTTTNKTDIATYSNKAGSDPTIQSRFLMESGRVAYIDGANAYGGDILAGSSPDGNSGSVGTSYAAPRVAAYAAIVRQKFPNVTAPNTADILLATARYDTLSCYPNCDKSIYGQGEASLSRALAPVGYLR